MAQLVYHKDKRRNGKQKSRELQPLMVPKPVNPSTMSAVLKTTQPLPAIAADEVVTNCIAFDFVPRFAL